MPDDWEAQQYTPSKCNKALYSSPLPQKKRLFIANHRMIMIKP